MPTHVTKAGGARLASAAGRSGRVTVVRLAGGPRRIGRVVPHTGIARLVPAR